MDPCEGKHQELAIHAIHHSPVSREERFEIFDSIGSLDGTCHETTKRCNEGSKETIGNTMELDGIKCHGDDLMGEGDEEFIFL